MPSLRPKILSDIMIVDGATAINRCPIASSDVDVKSYVSHGSSSLLTLLLLMHTWKAYATNLSSLSAELDG